MLRWTVDFFPVNLRQFKCLDWQKVYSPNVESTLITGDRLPPRLPSVSIASASVLGLAHGVQAGVRPL
jgi:hypothetical protein